VLTIDRAHAPDQFELRTGLLRLDLRLRLAVDEFRVALTESARDPFRGLYVSEAEIDELLAQTPPAEVARRLFDGAAGDAVPRLGRLARLCGLTTFEQDVLLVCLAPDLDLRYERLYAYLQDDATKRRPTVDLVLRLLCATLEERANARALLGPGSPLVRDGLVVLSDESARGAPLLARPLRLDERITEYLLGSDEIDPRIAFFSELLSPSQAAPTLTLPGDVEARLINLLRVDATEDLGRRGPVLYLHSAVGTGKRSTLRGLCALAERRLLMLDVVVLLASENRADALARAAREAELQDAVLALDGIDPLLADTPDRLTDHAALRRLLQTRCGPTVLLGVTRWEPAVWAADVPALQIALPPLTPTQRIGQWRRHVNGQLSAAEVTELAERYHLDDAGINAVASAARGRAVWLGRDQPASDDLRAAARAIATPPLDGLAIRLEPRYLWEDIVLSPDGLSQLRELCARTRYQTTVLDHWGYGRKHVRRGGTTGLFAGAPGTGKTMAAEIIAGELGLDLYRIELSAVVSKYIGETEKNLEKIFHAAEQGDAVLLFDEADAIFGKRSEVRDAHDRYANLEVAYLLQRLENYAGLAILTTNMRGNIDEAFVRRLDCIIEFPIPEEAERLAIWQLALPAEAPVAGEVDLAFLARKFKLAGGHIRNIALGAAFLAAAAGDHIRMKHLVWATRREYQKLGKLVAESDFEHYYRLLKDV
jgi:hypothetical protein